MKSRTKDIAFSLLAAAILAATVLYFLKGIQSEKLSEKADLFLSVPADCYAAVYIHRIAPFVRMMQQETASEVFRQTIPSDFLNIIRQLPAHKSCLIAYCAEGIVLFANPAEKQLPTLREKVFTPLSSGYPPQIQPFGGNKILYYPLKGNEFLGCYYRDGLLVCSRNKKLIEESVLQSRYRTSAPAGMELLRKGINSNAPACIFFRSGKFNLDLLPAGPEASATGEDWLSADLSLHEGELCAFGLVPSPALSAPDSLYSSLSDTLALRLSHLFPRLKIDAQFSLENGHVYYSACGKSGQSTVNPS